MDTNEADPEVPESHAPDNDPEVEHAMPSAPSPANEKYDATDKATQPDTTTRDNHKPLAHGLCDFGDEIQTLKAKILELEEHAKTESNFPIREASHPQLMTGMEQYKRMEACLYRHRKEWEQAVGPGHWDMSQLNNSDYIPVSLGSHGPWNYKWDMKPMRAYNRPNPFDPSHVCVDDQHNTESPLSDDFDHTIDYGARRERIRKNFEWDMDRLYLAEEIDRRKRGIVSQQTPETAGPVGPSQGPPTLPKKAPSIEPNAKISRMDWFSFQRMGYVNKSSGSVVEILEGEPIVDNDINGYRAWYGSSGRRTRIAEGTRDRESSESMLPGQAPLPERIRVRSESIAKIINTILKRTTPLEFDVMVFIRPFKALVLCEHELRDWCRALERKIAREGRRKKSPAAGPTGVIPEASIDFPKLEMKQAEGPVEKMVTAKEPSANDMGPAGASDASRERLDDVIHEGNDRLLEKDKSEGSQEGSDEEEDDSDDPAKSPKALEHLRVLLNFIDSEIVAKRKYLSTRQCHKVFFSDLWLLFRPGMEVIGMDGKQAYRVIDVTSPKHRVDPAWLKWYNPTGMQRKRAPFSITCVYIDFDGKNLGPVQRVFDFRSFDGERDVTSLEVYPLHFHPVRQANFSEEEWQAAKAIPEAERYRHKLIQRGIKFLNVASVKHMYYAGPTLETREEVESQHFRDKESKMRQREDLDIVRGKEGVAEMFKKPLIQITCGDLGTTAKEVETALETNFALANKWDCILLLDEADVFLAERNKEDFKRNGLVAVFLRVMEYYAGILFLTTNRVGDFDEAFTSRIHISLYYPELDQKKTADVFDINMKMIEQRFQKNGRAIYIDRVQIGRFAAEPFVDNQRARWNGRQIRNACQTALALAEFEAQGNSHTAILNPNAVVRLGVEHFEIVRDAYIEFTKYMDELYGTNAARRAKEARLRAMWLAENDSTLGSGKTMDRTTFALASQIHHQQQPQQQYHGFSQAPPSHYHQGVSPQIVHTQPQQEQPYYSYQNPAPQQSSYPDRSRMGGPPHNPALDQYRSNVTGNMDYPSFDGSQQGYDQTYAARQPSPMTTPTRQQEHPTNQPWLRDGIRSMYEPSGDRNPGQAPPGSVSPGPVGYTQGTPTWGPPRSQA
ncbi:hypothetical protein DBV05_g8541 [Lasiodiplodia theobromae]|uniref:Uncharacterized protein n=1 Tax=Lasiodiplodia theobromae TaxID=45133 RepID=A0A5N5D5X9_9PEZI|nr:hypothetical protein DBV05_g8541 [Lasiodiplodia theobromae]